MRAHAITRPETSEYAPYYGTYVQLVPEQDVLRAMKLQLDETLQFLRGLPESTGDRRYAPDKWSIKEVIGHMIDAERVFAQRALFFARKCESHLPSYDQEVWTAAATFGEATMEDLISEFELVRRSNLYFFQGLSEDAWTRRGIASDCEFTVRSLAYIILGHERHHLSILRSRYL